VLYFNPHKTMQLYGIPNCNTVKKARDWLLAHNIDYIFHDFKKEAPTEKLIKTWLVGQPWEKLVNRSGMTWRNLSESEKSAVMDAASATALMIEKPSVIKRPILMNGAIEHEIILHIGFSESAYEALFK